MKKILLLATAILFTFSMEAHALSWEYNLGAALQKAKTAQKPVMVDFYTDWCGWCKKLDSDTYSNPNVGKLAKDFICVKVDADKYKDDAAKYQVEGYPTILFLNYEGGIDERVVGYRGADDLTSIMSSVLKKTKKSKKPAVSKPDTAKAGGNAQFLLTGIFYDSKAPIAIINGATVKVGDKVDGATVKKITKLDVELECGGSTIILNIR